ncbi:DUF4082 domain-containing protein [Methyloglobulus sp.]|uniref:N,N-dimethylformamidase beta subunit family domain-containing protein n=1 Tax=Methyloglobulus sp. TaxID=2518622 RepID=UPI0032B7D7D4
MKKSNTNLGYITNFVFTVFIVFIFFQVEAAATCLTPANAIEAENCLLGNPESEWDVADAGDLSIQGFATNISVNRGQAVTFKINTSAANYRLDIYRMGYYAGNGARKIATVTLSVALPQSQPTCLSDAATGLVDCGNWANSASWTVPENATSGIYFAKVVRTDTGGASHIVFIVRNDTGSSQLLFQTSDTTWQAYNDYRQTSATAIPQTYNDHGGNSLYAGLPVGRAYKVSYNRPLLTRGTTYRRASLFGAEYPMVRWLEANGYDVSYTTGVDTDRSGAELLEHKIFLSVGHDEYWSAVQRSNVEAARNAGVNLAFFSGNEVFWKTRWENSIDGSGTSHRTLVSYKETKASNDINARIKIDPLPNIWTGTWRDPRSLTLADGGKPENGLTGTIFAVNCCQDGLNITVPQEYRSLRFWRNTSISTMPSNLNASLPAGVLGYEWDETRDNGFEPASLIRLSLTKYNLASTYILDYGNQYASGAASHSLTLYRHSSGALVFGAGTIRWSWGLDNQHDADSSFPVASVLAPSLDMKQATVNLFADMGAQPHSLQFGLVAATQSNDATPPISTISAPIAGATLQIGANVTITGTAIDNIGGGVVGGVEVSTDGGTSWHLATGKASWSYSWIPRTTGFATLMSRSVDDSGNQEAVGSSVTVTVTTQASCPCNIWPTMPTPVISSVFDTAAVELGVKFKSDVAGIIKGIRFYKGTANTGTHIGKLWSGTGQLLATAYFADETASGWQQVNFAVPVAITANTVYVASYFAPNGGYAFNGSYFAAQGGDNLTLHALQNGVNGGNGVFLYGAAGGFPANSFNSGNYWVDVVFENAVVSPDTISPTMPTGLSAAAIGSTQIGLTWTASTDNIAVTGYRVERCQGAGCTNFVQVATSATTSFGDTLLTAGTTYLYRVRAADAAGNLSAYSAVATQTTSVGSDTTPPTVPTGLNAAATGSNQIGLAWTASTDNVAVTGYRVERCQGAGCTNFAQVATSTTTSFGNTLLTAGTTYLYRVQATDAAGNLSAYSAVVSQTTLTTATSQTIWPLTATPANPAVSDTAAVELGVKFKSDVAGTIKGIRFYKGAANTGTHIGRLWSGTGQLLATAYFVGETVSGWQQVNFATPVMIAANTVYVASYFAPNGGYAFNGSYFTAQGVDNLTLHALQNGGASGGNGVFLYGAAGGFPVNSFNSGNYWVDVVFDGAVTPDTISPTMPTGLNAAATGSTQISLSWAASTDNVAVTGYRVERCQGAGCTNFVQIATSTTTIFGDTLLTAGTTYLYRVRAADAAGNLSPYSAVATATTPQASTPVAVADTFLFRSGTLRTVNYSGAGGMGVLANDSDSTSLSLSAQAIGTPPVGVALAANGVLTINSVSSTSFRYRANNGATLSLPTTGATVTLRLDSAPTTLAESCIYNRSGAGSIISGSACAMNGTGMFNMNLTANDTDPNVTTNIPTDGIGDAVTGAVITATGAGVSVSANSTCGQAAVIKVASLATIINNCDGTIKLSVVATAPASISLNYRALDDLGAQSATRSDVVTVQ